MRFMVLACLMAFLPARAADLEAVKLAVERMAAQGPLAGRLTEIYQRQVGEAGGPGATRAELALDLKADASVLDMAWDKGLLKRADEEERSRDRNGGGMPLREAMKELDPGRVSHLLDQRGSLLGLLERGRPLGVSAGSLEGRPVRKLEFSVPVRVPDDFLRARVSASEGRLVLWADGDGIPVASELTLSYSGRKGRIFGRFQSRSVIRTRYGVAGDRMFVAHRDMAESFADDSGRRTTSVALDFQAR